MDLSIGAMRERSLAEGPGERFAIWVQGCSIQCPSCFNPHFWNPKFGTNKSVSSLVKQILDAYLCNTLLEGITLLGGEPFEQPKSLGEVAREVKSFGLSVMVFTGYTLEELEDQSHPDFKSRKKFLKYIDLLVDGPYEAESIDLERPWVGSKNQRFHFLSSRYTAEEIFSRANDKLEITVSASGIASINGWATSDSLEKLLENL